MSLAMTRETLRRRIAALEARAAVKPLGEMAQADLDHARAALAAFSSGARLLAPKGKRPRKPKPRQVTSIVSGGLPGLGKRR